MREKALSRACLVILVIFGAGSVLMAWVGNSYIWKFPLALFPLLLVLFGVAFLGQSGLRMAFAGLALTIILAVFQFNTSPAVAAGASAVGFLKSFGISVSVAATMLMVFLMREAGALETVSKVVKYQVAGDEMRALYIGIGFGSFLSALGVVTPALFPPLLVAMGFTPIASIAIAVLGYDPTTSFSLLSIPITLPAQVGQLDPIVLAFKIVLFLPLISTGFAFAILWLVGGRRSMRKGAVPALICGLTLAFACFGTVSIDYFSGVEYVPLRIVGVIAGLIAMMSLFIYQKLRHPESSIQKPPDYPGRDRILRAFSPWIILAALAALVSIPTIGSWLSQVPGHYEQIQVFANQTVDLDILSQIYTWIFVAVALSIFTLKLSRKQIRNSFNAWLKRFLGPFFAYSLYFCVAFVMAWSAMEVGTDGALVQSPSYNILNMNVILGSTLAAIFGIGYIFVAASLGLFGAIVGGSETSSNVLFLNIQKTAVGNIGLGNNEFMTIYGSHAAAGGIASAVTPAKINNAVVTIDAGHKTEALIMRKHLVVALLLTIGTGMLTGVLVSLGI